ncbi:hypothetical protein B0H13DRAFT_2384632 [Mycena leptocephala]|nr:hypothetical protein B0H13DRAFT_2384632 [Mycena leptocephala]
MGHVGFKLRRYASAPAHSQRWGGGRVRREHILSLAVVLSIPLLLRIPLLNAYAYARDFDIEAGVDRALRGILLGADVHSYAVEVGMEMDHSRACILGTRTFCPPLPCRLSVSLAILLLKLGLIPIFCTTRCVLYLPYLIHITAIALDETSS